MRVQTFSRAQILQEFRLQCQTLSANKNRGLKQEFEELEAVGKDLPARAGESGPNREKNRYPYILPYDHCRVRLSLQNSQPHSDYINANFVPGGESERDFICTQGPLHNTIADFWRMVWEQNVRIIVMVTALRQKDQVMCEKYWPLDRGTVHHGMIQVTTVTRKQGPDYFVTIINLRQREPQTDRTITHYYYPTWPDQGVPRDLASLVAFTEHVRLELEAIPRLGPAVVHCSAGVGRSGTFVTLLWLMQLCARGIQPNVRAAVQDLRLHRMWMVQNLVSPVEQYLLVHQCLLNWLSGGASARSLSQGASSGTDRHAEDQPHGSSGRGGRRSRSRAPPPERQSPAQHALHPGKLLRRLLPSWFNTAAH
ncbi:receptor-type tyrosine-protein phosphatase V-like isoform X1 [Pungitius pungitius]|uniref:receptor-type tyrosine-protein phosphatase V-like isoform X1 n=1 Tax=Pungitius pungitius TaxID=134920 RepID=UPI002E129760